MLNNPNHKNIAVLITACLAVLCTQAGLTMYSASIPALPQLLGASYSEAAYTLTFYVLGYGIAMLLFGGISDHLGRKNSYLLTILIFSVTSLCLAWTKSIYLFIFLRFLQGIGGGGCAVIGRASVRDVFEGKKLVSAMSYISLAFNVSMGFFQFTGGMIQSHFSYKTDFILMSIFGLCITLLIIFTFQETNLYKRKIAWQELFANYKSIIADKYLIIYAAGAGMGYSIILVFNVLGIFYLRDSLRINPDTIGAIGIYFSAAYLIGSIVLNYLIRLFEINQIILAAKTILLISGILVFISSLLEIHSLTLILLPLLLGLAGQAMLYPCAMVKALQPYKNLSGSASSLFGFSQQVTGFIILTIAGFLPYQSQLSLGIVMLLIGLGCFFIFDQRR